MTRNFGGECGSFSICKLVVSSVTAEHHTLNQKPNKNHIKMYENFPQTNKTQRTQKEKTI